MRVGQVKIKFSPDDTLGNFLQEREILMYLFHLIPYFEISIFYYTFSSMLNLV